MNQKKDRRSARAKKKDAGVKTLRTVEAVFGLLSQRADAVAYDDHHFLSQQGHGYMLPSFPRSKSACAAMAPVASE